MYRVEIWAPGKYVDIATVVRLGDREFSKLTAYFISSLCNVKKKNNLNTSHKCLQLFQR